MKSRLSPCKPSDVKLLAQLSIRTFKDAFERDNNPDDFETYLKSAFTVNKLADELANTNSKFFFIYLDNSIVGYLKINMGSAQTDVLDKKALGLERVYILKAFQGKRLGSWALQSVIELAKEHTMPYVWLGVWERNTRAISFYERFGFKKFGEHPYFIGSDRQTDWLMRFDLD